MQYTSWYPRISDCSYLLREFEKFCKAVEGEIGNFTSSHALIVSRLGSLLWLRSSWLVGISQDRRFSEELLRGI